MTINHPPRIWLLQDGEALPTDENPRLMRTGNLAEKLVAAGFDVTWWTSRFNHNLKKLRALTGDVHPMGEHYRIRPLDGPGYTTNLSIRRIRHYRALAAHFTERAQHVEMPDLILGSMPSPELCGAGMRFAKQFGVPFVVDIRDPWPDIFADYFHPRLRWALWPLIQHYRRQIGAIMASADRIVAVSDSMLDWGVRYANRERRDTDKVFYIGYNQQAARELVVPEQFTENEPLLCLFATTCGNSYDGTTLIEAARLLETSGERRVAFIMSGDGEWRQRWVAQAAGLKSVNLTGWISHEELQAHFLKSHVGLILMHGGITSYWLGNKICEYLSTSLALVNNVSGESSALVESRGLGLNVPAKDARALADAIRRLLDSPDTVRKSMSNAKQVFEEEFERGKIYDRYVSYLVDTLSPHRRPQGHNRDPVTPIQPCQRSLPMRDVARQ